MKQFPDEFKKRSYILSVPQTNAIKHSNYLADESGYFNIVHFVQLFFKFAETLKKVGLKLKMKSEYFFLAYVVVTFTVKLLKIYVVYDNWFCYCNLLLYYFINVQGLFHYSAALESTSQYLVTKTNSTNTTIDRVHDK